MSKDLDRRLLIIESNYGRDHGWFLEHQGACIAVLEGPKAADMFWETYRIEPATNDPRAVELLRSNEFWASCNYAFRNRGFRDEVVDRAYGGRGPGEGEVTVRGLYIPIKEPTFWEAARSFQRLRRARVNLTT